MYRLMDIGGPMHYTVHNPNLCNASTGVIERVILSNGEPPLVVNEQTFNRRMDGVYKAMEPYIRQAQPLEPSEFHLQYEDSRRRKSYKRACDSLVERPLEYKDSFLQAFVKVEKVCEEKLGVSEELLAYTSDKKQKVCIPRIISPRTPRYLLSSGIYIKPIEKSIYRMVNGAFKERTIAKGLNALDRGILLREKWCSYDNPVAIGLDASRFDAHVNRVCLKWEHRNYRRLYRNCTVQQKQELSKILQWQLSQRGFVNTKDGRIKWSRDGGRCSGDMNTALGNCMVMSCMVWSWLDSIDMLWKCKFINDGDDGVIICDERDVGKLHGCAEWFRDMGFKMKISDPVYVFERIEFCRCRPVWTPHGYKMVRNVREVLSKEHITWKPITSEKYWNKYRNSLSLGGLALAGDMPILRSYYRTLGRGAKGTTQLPHSSLQHLTVGMYQSEEIVTRTRVSFMMAFGYTPGEQKTIERLLDSKTPVFKLVGSPVDKYNRERIHIHE